MINESESTYSKMKCEVHILAKAHMLARAHMLTKVHKPVTINKRLIYFILILTFTHKTYGSNVS